MMSKPIIAVDIDDVLAQGTESLRREVNRRLNTNLTPEHYAVPGEYWGYYERVWQANGLEGRVTMEELSPQMASDQSHVPPFAEAFSVLDDLKKHYQLLVVTARDLAWEKATRFWLDTHFPGMFTDVYFAGHHKLDRQTKGQLCKELGAGWLIDDNVVHAQSAIDEGLRVVLFGTYGWHANQQIDTQVVRCKDWRAVKEYFDGIEA